MDTLLKAISGSMFVSSVIPAIIFVIVTVCIFSPEWPVEFFAQFTSNEPETGDLLIFLAALALLLTYILTVMNSAIVRMYEGYYFPLPIQRLLAEQERRRFRKFSKRVNKLKEALPAPEFPPGTEPFQRAWREYITKKDLLIASFPESPNRFLPCRLGNIYRASEDYPFANYGMDGVFFWPRLAKVIPKDYEAKVNRLNETIAFHLNTSLVSALVGIEVIAYKVMTYWQLQSWIIGGGWQIRIPLPKLDLANVDLKTLILTLVCFGLSYSFYRAATATALTYGHYIRTCYDLFRMDLLKDLNIDPPEKPGGKQEQQLWRAIHEFLALENNEPYQKLFDETKLPTKAESKKCPQPSVFKALIRLILRK